MTQTNQPVNSNNTLRPVLPVRTPGGASLTTNEHVDQYAQNTVNEGKKISALLADVLKTSSVAGNAESNLQLVLSLAEELRNYQSPVEFSIGLVGDSGVGKSSLINSLLDTNGLAKTAGSGSACTTVVTEYRQKRLCDNATYTIEVECMEDREIQDLLQQCVVDYRRYHLLDRSGNEGPESSEIERLGAKAKLAWDTILAAFGDYNECNEERFQDPHSETDAIILMVLRWKDQIPWSQNGLHSRVTTLTATDEKQCDLQIEECLKSLKWPFIKVVRIYLEAKVLEKGIVLIDLPGFRDSNSARVRITETRLYQCDEIFVVTEIGRAITNKGVEDLVIRQLGKNFNSLKRSQGVTIICTKSEVLGQESEILRDIPRSDQFNATILQRLQDQIDEAEDEGLPFATLKANRTHRFIYARNNHVKRKLIDRYSRVRKIHVFCISNTLYHKATTQQKNAHRRRSSSNISTDRASAAEQMKISSCIPELQDFVRGVSSKSQIDETRHFLNTKLVNLVEKAEMWLNANLPGIVATQPSAPEFVLELEADLKQKFDIAVNSCDSKFSTAKSQVLRQPLTQGMRTWEAAALVAISKWERWHHATFLAFWNRDGAHETTKQPFTDWNAEIIQAMVESMEPAEDAFREESQRIFNDLNTSVHQCLDSLPLQLGELLRVETFPRRRRDLDYEIEKVMEWFDDEIQSIFHDLFKTHGSSYVMHCLLPMYSTIDSGGGVTKRRVAALKSQIRDEKLFRKIRDLCITAVTALLMDLREKIQEQLDKCRLDIKNDLDIVRGESIRVDEQGDFIAIMYSVLDEAKVKRTAIVQEFEREIAQLNRN